MKVASPQNLRAQLLSSDVDVAPHRRVVVIKDAEMLRASLLPAQLQISPLTIFVDSCRIELSSPLVVPRGTDVLIRGRGVGSSNGGETESIDATGGTLVARGTGLFIVEE